MKHCPICNAITFDDAARCYGCLHEFDQAGRIMPNPFGKHAYAQTDEGGLARSTQADENLASTNASLTQLNAGSAQADAQAEQQGTHSVQSGMRPAQTGTISLLLTIKPPDETSDTACWSCTASPLEMAFP